MWMEPSVARAKFDQEVERLQRQQELLRSWGIWLQEVSFPNLFLVCVPRHRVVLSIPVASPLVLAGGQQAHRMVTVNCPSLAGRAFGVRLGLDDYDMRPPSVTFIDAWTREPLKFEEMVRAQHETAPKQFTNVLLAPHPSTGLPFLCLRGIREYHEHPQHTGDDWMLYRGDLGVFSVVTNIWRTCMDAARPNVVLGSPLQVLWEAGLKAQ